MGGEGSGRKPDPIKQLMGFNQPATTTGETLYLPNYSGVKKEVLKISPGVPYGSMYGDDINKTVAIAAKETYYAVSSLGATVGVSNEMTFQNTNEFVIKVAGYYLINWSGVLKSGGANQNVSMAIMINSTAKPETEGSTKLTSANDNKAVAGTGIISLSVGDIVKFCAENETDAVDIIITHITFSMVKIA